MAVVSYSHDPDHFRGGPGGGYRGNCWTPCKECQAIGDLLPRRMPAKGGVPSGQGGCVWVAFLGHERAYFAASWRSVLATTRLPEHLVRRISRYTIAHSKLSGSWGIGSVYFFMGCQMPKTAPMGSLITPNHP